MEEQGWAINPPLFHHILKSYELSGKKCVSRQLNSKYLAGIFSCHAFNDNQHLKL